MHRFENEVFLLLQIEAAYRRPTVSRATPPPHARQLFRRHGPAAAAVRSAQSTPRLRRSLIADARQSPRRHAQRQRPAEAVTMRRLSPCMAVQEPRNRRKRRPWTAPSLSSAAAAASQFASSFGATAQQLSSSRPQRAVDPRGSVHLSSPMRHGPAQLPVSCGAAARRSPEPAFYAFAQLLGRHIGRQPARRDRLGRALPLGAAGRLCADSGPHRRRRQKSRCRHRLDCRGQIVDASLANQDRCSALVLGAKARRTVRVLFSNMCRRANSIR